MKLISSIYNLLKSFYFTKKPNNHLNTHVFTANMTIETKLDNCQHCAQCCIGEEILVEEDEIKVIAERTGMNPEDFTRVHWYEILEYYVIEQKQNNNCIFLKRDEKTFTCEVYEFRPHFCAQYPSNKRQLEWCKDKLNNPMQKSSC
tara:strand:+ start:6014 stop:6451 length:438 start_codon:yes stop_codon:yes gene_type:complete